MNYTHQCYSNMPYFYSEYLANTVVIFFCNCNIQHIFPSAFLQHNTFSWLWANDRGCLSSLHVSLLSQTDLKTIRVSTQRPLRERRPLLCPQNMHSPACSLNQTYCHAVY